MREEVRKGNGSLSGTIVDVVDPVNSGWRTGMRVNAGDSVMVLVNILDTAPVNASLTGYSVLHTQCLVLNKWLNELFFFRR